MEHQKKQSFCELKETQTLKKSKIIRYRNGRWRGVKNQPYKTKEGNWSLIERFPLIYSPNAKFEVRYFEISKGGKSSLEYHQHVHVVMCLRGRGKIRIGKRIYSFNYLDIAYIAPNEVHQLINPYDEPFGFLCIVDRDRDRPIELEG